MSLISRELGLDYLLITRVCSFSGRNSMSPKEVVLAYWQAMQSNDFAKASEWLNPDFECYWLNPRSSS